ncbi:hypothetical protein AVEN_30438-1 [Araneus ventricosus]|uniref:Uncharacterized protein n=1 Tax=Araneus ventricosus TaxID=182803 RepID=A0A4Y2MX19_ARAVE|nr:hypothetical protein AVEN_30438-1 [Araneus ventricosus]
MPKRKRGIIGCCRRRRQLENVKGMLLKLTKKETMAQRNSDRRAEETEKQKIADVIEGQNHHQIQLLCSWNCSLLLIYLRECGYVSHYLILSARDRRIISTYLQRRATVCNVSCFMCL